MMKRHWLVGVLLILLGAQGCASLPGVSPFTAVDLARDMDAPTLERYRAESDAVVSAGQGGNSVLLEKTNWWLLGLLAYWRQGTVEAVHSATCGTVYVVSESRGYGPLSLFYVAQKRATFADDGSFAGGMKTGSVLWGHVAMLHVMTAGHAGRGHVHRSLGLLHHLINLDWGHDGVAFSLFSAPNPVGFGT